MTRYTDPTPKYTDQSGEFMPYGLLYFFDSGTNTDKDTFADVNETIKNSQPLVLNGDGSVPNCFYSGSAKVILVTNAGTSSAPVDGVQQWERDPVSSSSLGAIGRDWDAVSIYDENSVVVNDEVFFISIINNNQNNNPSSTPTAWSQFDLLNRWNTNETYSVRDPVIATDFTIYISQVNSNTGNDPISSPSEWLPSGVGSGGGLAFVDWDLSIDYPVGGTAIVTASDGNYYTSIQTPNLNQDPTVSPTFWAEIDLLQQWNINNTYEIDDPVTFDNVFYTALTGANTGNQPDVSPSDWSDGGIALKAPIDSPAFTGPITGTGDITLDKAGTDSTGITALNDDGGVRAYTENGDAFLASTDSAGDNVEVAVRYDRADNTTELHGDGAVKLITTSTGVAVTGEVTTTDNVTIQKADGTQTSVNVRNTEGGAQLAADNTDVIVSTTASGGGTNEIVLRGHRSADTEIYQNNTVGLTVGAAGATVIGGMTLDDNTLTANSLFIQTTTGGLQLLSENDITVLKSTNSSGGSTENIILYDRATGATVISHVTGTKITTTAGGAAITGDITASGATPVGASSLTRADYVDAKTTDGRTITEGFYTTGNIAVCYGQITIAANSWSGNLPFETSITTVVSMSADLFTTDGVSAPDAVDSDPWTHFTGSTARIYNHSGNSRSYTWTVTAEI